MCPGCEYVVPSAWEVCERCGASLDLARPVEPAVTAASTRMRGPRPDLTPAARTPPVATARCTPRRGSWDPPPAPRRAPRVDSAWLDGDDDRARRRWRFPVIGPLAVVVAVVSLLFAWHKFTHPPVPTVLRPWAQHGAGYELAPAGAGFRVRLPAAPVVTTTQLTLGTGLDGFADVAMSRVGPYEVGAVWLSVPYGTLDANGSDPLTVAGDIAGRAGSFRIEVPSTAHQGGLAALEAEVSHESQDGDALVVVHGAWVYAVVVSGPGKLDTAFVYLRKTLVIG